MPANDDRSAIPLIDLGESATSVAEQLDKACQDPGFMILVNHGVDASTITGMLETSRRFFAQDAELKLRFASPSGDRYRGYTVERFGQRRSGRTGGPPLQEGFEVAWLEDRAAVAAAGYPEDLVESFSENIWPDTPAEFREVWRTYFAEVKGLGDRLLEHAARALHLPPDWFVTKFDRPSSMLLVNHYPPQEEHEREFERFRPHTDYGAFTVLYQDVDAGGLEIQQRGGGWVRVPFIPGSFVVNLGDLMAKWTNDRWAATLHRVRPPEAHERGLDRISIPFFQQPNYDALIETLPTCLAEGELPRYPPVVWRDWMRYRYAATAAVDVPAT